MKEIDKIKENIKNGGLKIKLVCRAIDLLMPKYYKYLKASTTSEFKRVLLTHEVLGQWQKFPTIQEMETYSGKSIAYFSTFLTLLEDRGAEQEKYVTWKELWLPDILTKKPINSAFERILREDEKNEKFNEANSTISDTERGELFFDCDTGKTRVFDGTDWKEVG